VNDLKNGFGTFFYEDGSVYRGDYLNDLKNGIGEFTSTEGKSLKAVWEKGQIT
jgi:hypothetical protein